MANRTKATEQLSEFAQSKKVISKQTVEPVFSIVTVLSFNNYSAIPCHVHVLSEVFFLILITNVILYVV